MDLRCSLFLLILQDLLDKPAADSCDLGDLLPCCDLQYWTLAKQRHSPNPERLLEMIATAKPIDKILGINDISTPPMGADLTQLTYAVSLSVMRLFRIDQRAQTYRMKYRITWKWRDCRTLYADNITVFTRLSVPSSSTYWREFFRPVHDVREELEAMRGQDGEFLTLRSDGLVSYSETHVSEFACPFDFYEMPFDEQECVLSLSTPNLGPPLVRLVWNTHIDGGIKLLGNLSFPEWEVDQQSQWKATNVETDGSVSAMVSAKFKIKRRPIFTVLNYIIPTVLYWLTSWLGLWINNDAVPARITIGIIPVLTMTNKMNALAEALPPISSTTRLQSFMVMSLIVITLQMIEYGVVHETGRMSYFLRRFLKRKREGERKKHDKDEVERKKSDAPDVESQDSEHASGGADATFAERELAMALRINKWIDFHSRWVFGLTYVIATCLIFYA